MEQKFRHMTLDGFDYYCLNVKRNDDGEALLKLELKKRIFKLRLNIEKCGSFEKMEEMGGAATQKFLKRTRNMLRNYLFESQLEYLLTSLEDVQDAVVNVNSSTSIYDLVEKASWPEIEEYAQFLRNSLIEKWMGRRIMENKQKEIAGVA